MKSLICLTVFFLFFTFALPLYAQGISGKVTDSDKKPLPGVNISNSDASINAITDFDGNFTIVVPSGTRLKFSMIGFETLNLNATAAMNVVMAISNKQLEEVVVVGYGTRKKGAITGSVSQIKSDDIVRTPAQSAIQGIQGKAAGVNIVTNDEPGAKPTILIRGLGTVLGNRTPLYVIDGLEATSLNGLSANDIATIDLLKDASSLAIYGQKGANGVIIVTTKKGKKGEVRISYDSYYGQKQIQHKVKLADSYRYAYFNNTALGSSTYYSFNQPVNTNWLNEITKTGEVSNNSVSFSGASENINYYLGLSHYTEKGILIGTDYKRSNIISKNEFKFSDKFKVTQSINVSVADNTPKPLGAFTSAYKQSPIVPVRYANGRFGAPLVNAAGVADLTGQVMNNVGNPVADLYFSHEKNKNVTLFGDVGAELELLKGLKFNTNFGATADWGKGYSFTPNLDIALSRTPSQSAEEYIADNPKEPINTLEQRRSDLYEWNWDNYLTYKKSIGDHDFTIVAGMSRTTTNNSENFNARRTNVPVKSNYWYLDFSENKKDLSPDNYIDNYHSTPRVSIAYFGRLEYSYNNKYLFTASIRKEGISVFQTGKKWGIFPAVSAGWVVSQEEFMKNVSFINSLKLRGGYGEVGNGNGPSFNYIAFSLESYPLGGVSQPGTNSDNAIDKNLTWETMKEFDFGMDFTVLKNHVSGTLDFYNRKSEDLILNVQLPEVLSENETYINAGEVTNKGIEVSLRWDDSIGENFKYYIGGNYSQNKNEVSKISSRYFDKLTGGDISYGRITKQVKLGQPLGSFYVFQQTGYNSDGAPVYNDMVDGKPGLTDDDRINAGSYIPKYTYAINIGASYKNFDASVETYGVGGNKIFNGKKSLRNGGENVEYDVLDSFWTPSNPNAINPKPSNDIPQPSTYFIEDGAYFKISNITIGYSLPKTFKKIDKVRFYVTAVNPFIFTDYSGYSPELSGDDNGNPLKRAGIELDAYPTNKSYLVGANVSF